MTAGVRRAIRGALVALAIGACLERATSSSPSPAAAAAPADSALAAAADSASAAPAESIRAYLNDGRYAEAEGAARRLAALREREPGGGEAEPLADALDLLVEALWRGGRSGADSTLALAERNVALRERIGGPARLRLWQSLDNLATIHRERGDYAAARAVLERAVALCDSLFDANDHRTAIVLNSLGIILEHAGDTGAALAAHTRALAIREARYGADDFMVSQSLHSLGVLSLRTTDYAGAQRYFERAIRIRERKLGPEHRELAATLVNLAIAHFSLGEYVEARPLLERAARILETALGPDHPDVAVAYNNLGAILAEMGDPGAALPAFERALAITEARYGYEHLSVAGYCANIGVIEKQLGAAAAAERRFRRALAIFEVRPPGPYQVDAILCTTALGEVLLERGEVDSARALDERAVAVAESTLGAEHPTLADALEALADVLDAGGERPGAAAAIDRALAIRRGAQGAGHPAVASALARLARFARDGGDLARACALESDACAILNGALGAGHPSTAEAEARLARDLAAAGDTTRAFVLALRSEESMRAHLRLASRGLSERQALGYAANRHSSLDTAIEIASASRDAAVVRAAWDAGVRSRAIVLDEMAARVRGVERGGDADAARLASEYAAASRRLANLVVRGLGPDEPDAYRVLVDAARRERDAAERALAARSARFRREASGRSVGLDDALAALPPRSALVAYFRSEAEEGLGAERYVAFVARSDGGGASSAEPRAVALGSASVIDARVRGWRQLMALGAGIAKSEAKAANGGDAPSREPELEAAGNSAGSALRARVWDPIAPSLAGAERVFIVPDAALSLINFAALPDESGGYLAETGPVLHFVSAERDLATDAAEDAGAPPFGADGLLALGGPDFDTAPWLDAGASAGSGGGAAAANATAPVAQYRGLRPVCEAFAQIHFERLPEAEREVDEIAALWRERAAAGSAGGARARAGVVARALPLTGRDATETALKRLAPEFGVLHVATHGFFLGDQCLAARPLSRGIGALAPAKSSASTATGSAPSTAHEPPAARVSEDSHAPSAEAHPLRISGLVLAGANHRANAGANEEDGILTAEEISALDLSRVSWCVLSACETGVADLHSGEGVLGLRRAARVAGARTLISSLWPVGDEATRAWMRALYEARLARGLDTASAVQAASRAILAERRARGASTHPFLWAGFVASGDWR